MTVSVDVATYQPGAAERRVDHGPVTTEAPSGAPAERLRGADERPSKLPLVTIAPAPIVSRPSPAHVAEKGSRLSNLLRTTDHKTIGLMYLATSFAFFIDRRPDGHADARRAGPAGHAVPVAGAVQPAVHDARHDHAAVVRDAAVLRVRNLIMPLQIGAPDVAFPRLNAFSYWLFLFGSLDRDVGLPRRPAARPTSAGRPTRRCPTAPTRPGAGGNLWIAGLAVSGLGTILGGVNFITTIVCLRAPGMTMFRMPIFTWNALVTSVLILLAFPILTAALFGLLADRNLGALVYSSENGGADALAAPVLVLRAPRGLHHRAAVLRHHHRGHPGLQPQAAVRLQGHGRRDAGHRRSSRWPCGRTTCTPPAPCCCRSSPS